MFAHRTTFAVILMFVFGALVAIIWTTMPLASFICAFGCGFCACEFFDSLKAEE
jgi:hypothetical protein